MNVQQVYEIIFVKCNNEYLMINSIFMQSQTHMHATEKRLAINISWQDIHNINTWFTVFNPWDASDF